MAVDHGNHDIKSRGFIENFATPSISSGTLTLDLNSARIFRVTLNANITTLSITNVPNFSNTCSTFALMLTANGTGYTITWPTGTGGIKWANGTTPTITSTINKIDIFTFITYDAGVSWLGLIGGQNF